MDPCRYQPRNVGHIYHEVGPHGVGDFPESPKIDGPRIGAGAGNDHFGPVFLSQLRHLLIVYGLGVASDAVGDNLKSLPEKLAGLPWVK